MTHYEALHSLIAAAESIGASVDSFGLVPDGGYSVELSWPGARRLVLTSYTLEDDVRRLPNLSVRPAESAESPS